MSQDRRQAGKHWYVDNEEGSITWDGVKIAVLMDIRDELQKLNQLLGCSNFTEIPTTLRGIRTNTKPKSKPRRKVKR